MGPSMECWTDRLRSQCNNDHGFMGFTHALSGLAAMTAILAFAPKQLVSTLGTGNISVLILAFLCTIGATLIPDLDNTTSRAIKDLGIFGPILSHLFRWSSKILQTVIRTRRDDPDPNPHRGAWHTPAIAAVASYGIYLLSSLTQTVSIPGLGHFTYGALFTWFMSSMLVLLTFSTLMKKQTDDIKKSSIFGAIIILLICMGITGALIVSSGSSDFRWLGISLFAGMFIHILGDAFTTYGAPLFFPLSAVLFGKFWWTTRFTKMQAGKNTEKFLVTGVLMLVIIVSLVRIAYYGLPPLKP